MHDIDRERREWKSTFLYYYYYRYQLIIEEHITLYATQKISEKEGESAETRMAIEVLLL